MTDEELVESARRIARALDQIMEQLEERGWKVSFKYDTWPLIKRPLDIKVERTVSL